MKLVKINNKIRCELGVCGNMASYALTMERTGIRSRIYMCDECIAKLYAATKQVLNERKRAERRSSAEVNDAKR